MFFYCNEIILWGVILELKFYNYSNHKVAVEQHYFLLQPGEWLIEPQRATAYQTHREDKNSQTCCIDPSLKAVAHLLTSLNEKLTVAAKASIFTW